MLGAPDTAVREPADEHAPAIIVPVHVRDEELSPILHKEEVPAAVVEKFVCVLLDELLDLRNRERKAVQVLSESSEDFLECSVLHELGDFHLDLFGRMIVVDESPVLEVRVHPRKRFPVIRECLIAESLSDRDSLFDEEISQERVLLLSGPAGAHGYELFELRLHDIPFLAEQHIIKLLAQSVVLTECFSEHGFHGQVPPLLPDSFWLFYGSLFKPSFLCFMHKT